MHAEGSMILALGGAFWLGVLTSVSPCPMATNVAAIGCLARRSQSRALQLLSGLGYALGRAAAYTLVGAFIAWGLLSAPVLSSFLQKHLGQLLGPMLVLAGMVLLGMLPGLPAFGCSSDKLGRRLADMGVAGSALLGFLFALAFCPVSAALFFGSLLPLAIRQESTWLLPAVFGLGSALPVLAFGILLTLARESATRAFGCLRQCDRWLLPASGWLLVGIGLLLIFRQWFGGNA
jgi:cytochrome c biogenesis protein CcdA